MRIFRRTNAVGALATVACSIALMLSGPAVAHAQTEIWNAIYPRGGAPFCLDVPNGSGADKVKLQLYTCNRGSNQKWYVEHSGANPDVLIIQNVASEKCMDIPDGSSANDVKVQQYRCNNGANQTFTLDSGTGLLRSNLTGKCVVAHSYNKGSNIYQYDCAVGTSTEWTYS